VVAPGTPGLQQIIDEFGDTVLGADGALDRERMAAVVFADDDARQRLNAIVHPLVGAAMVQRTVRAGEHNPHAVVVNDVPLLAEGGLRDRYDVVVVVDVDPETQLRRLVDIRGMSEEDARARVVAQASREQRRAVATYVIDNAGTREDLRERVAEVFAELSGKPPRS
jgi:dephospho-CoA kinase